MSMMDYIVASMDERPNDFREGHFVLRDSKTKTEYWIANGFWFYGVHSPRTMKFTLWEKARFSLALRRLNKARKHELGCTLASVEEENKE
jgi:hypothetical protein